MVEQLSLKKEIRVPLRALDSGNHGPELSQKASFRPSWPSRPLAEPAARLFLGAGGWGLLQAFSGLPTLHGSENRMSR